MSTRRKVADKQSLKLPLAMVLEMRREASRLERSLSWTAQEAWRRARKRIQMLPGAADTG